MPYVKDTTYCHMPFRSETPQGDFYTYASLQELAERSEINKEEVFRCRTIGILQSIYGRFYLSDLDIPVSKSEPLVQVSLVYLKNPPPSTVIPYPVQVFGTMQWKKRPVIFVKILQVYNTAMAVRLRDTMQGIAKVHIAKSFEEELL